MKHNLFWYYQQGQIGLVVLLIMAVLLTMGIGVASESVVSQKTARQEVESSDTFNAAESGVEQALSQDLSGIATTLDTPADVFVDAGSWNGNVTVKATATNTFTKPISVGDSSEVNLTGSTSMTVEWSAGSDCASTASLIVTLFSRSDNSLVRYAYGPNCRSGDSFTQLSQSGGLYSVNNINTSGYDFARIKAVYAPAQVTVSGDLPVQQYQIVSQAEKDSGETRAVSVDKGLPVAPSIFDYAVFAGQGGLTITP